MQSRESGRRMSQAAAARPVPHRRCHAGKSEVSRPDRPRLHRRSGRLLLSLAQAATRDILLLGRSMLTGLWGVGSDNFILKAIFGPASRAKAFAALRQLRCKNLKVKIYRGTISRAEEPAHVR